MKHALIILLFLTGLSTALWAKKTDLTSYVNTLQGTNSKYELTRGNTYPTTALPWGMNFGHLKQARMEVAGFINTLKIQFAVSDKPTNAALGPMTILYSH